MQFINEFKKMYSHLKDDESRFIFCERVLYSLTGDVQHIRNIVLNTDEGRKAFDSIIGNNCYIFGAGLRGRKIKKVFFQDDKNLSGFLDNDPQKISSKIDGVLVYKPDEIVSANFEGKVIIAVKQNYIDIISQLISLGISEENILNFSDIMDTMAKKQYFTLEQLPHVENEVFCDVGCYDGESSIQFEKWSKQFSHIYCFEPDPKNVSLIREKLNYCEDRVTIIEKGLWSSNTKLHFKSLGNTISCIDDEGEISVDVATLDDVVINHRVTFIKMDIEGSEYQALLGAAKIIQRDEPKLAICIYHKDEDIYAILKLLLDLNPNYKFYIRHYSLYDVETILYAFI